MYAQYYSITKSKFYCSYSTLRADSEFYAYYNLLIVLIRYYNILFLNYCIRAEETENRHNIIIYNSYKRTLKKRFSLKSCYCLHDVDMTLHTHIQMINSVWMT